MKERGFTLIELLVVIAIIGLLAAVVLASLGSARSKGADAAVKSNLDGMRAQAELTASNNSNSYATVCADAAAALSAAAGATGASVGATDAVQTAKTTSAAGSVACSDAQGSCAASAPLSAVDTYWCVDSSGKAMQTNTELVAAATTCS